jgi:hypothetical protein
MSNVPPGFQQYEVNLRNISGGGPLNIIVVITARGETQAIQIAKNQNRGYEIWSSRRLLS